MECMALSEFHDVMIYRSSNGDLNDVFFIVCHTCSCISLLKGRTCSLTPILMKLDL